MTSKRALYQLVDRLPESTWSEAERLLESLLGDETGLPPSLRNVPWDDEPESEEERELVQEAHEAIARGEVVRDEDLDHELGW